MLRKMNGAVYLNSHTDSRFSEDHGPEGIEQAYEFLPPDALAYAKVRAQPMAEGRNNDVLLTLRWPSSVAHLIRS